MTENATDIEYYKALESMISAKGLTGRVRITGYLGKRDIPDVMAATDICIAPFVSTAASGVLSLSIGYRKPIVASDISVHREINGRIPCLELFKNGDRKDLLQKIAGLLGDSKRMKTLSDAATAYSRQYSYANTAKTTIRLYEDLLSAGRMNDTKQG